MNFSSAEQHYVLWIKSSCPWCKKAEEILIEKSLPYHIFVMDGNLEELGRVKEKHSWDTVPIVFEITSRGSFTLIGGYTDLEKHLGDLDENNSVQTDTNEKIDAVPN
jgi:glutaredoxin|tara:strand:- start:3043 stop:3363 length:321 start_codon:yes stop_codon:yes gene_type:complete